MSQAEAELEQVPRTLGEFTASNGKRWRRAVGVALVGLSSFAFAASFGFNFPAGNQMHYFLPALRILDPTLFRRDWLLTETTQYHQAFAYFGALLMALDENGWAVAVTFTVVAAIGIGSLFFVLRACAGARLAVPTFLLLVAIAFFTRTRGPGTGYVFDGTLQPSALSGAFVLAAFPAFVTGRYLASGLALGIAGLLHMNILVLTCAAFGLAHLLLGRATLLPRLVRQLGPALVVLAAYSTMLLQGASGVADAVAGRSMYLEVRAPHHFNLSVQWVAFLPLVGWLLMGFGALVPLSRTPGPHRSLAALIAGLSAVIWGGVLATFFAEQARVLFSWRLTGHLELLLQAATLLLATRVMVDPTSLRDHGPLPLSSIGAGYALVLFADGRDTSPGLVRLLLLIGVATLACFWLPRLVARFGPERRSDGGSRRGASGARDALTAGAALVLATFSLGILGRVPLHSNLLRPRASDSAALFSWIRGHTPVDALFLTPPDLDAVRILGRRAIVVDWKCNPGIPSEVSEWRRRLLAVTGLRDITSASDLSAYDTLDQERLELLRVRYRLDYAVVRRGREAGLPYPHAFADGKFVVLDVSTAPPPATHGR